MIAMTSDKALLRTIWELVEHQPGRRTVSQAEIEANMNGTTPVEGIEPAVEVLEGLGLVRVGGSYGDLTLELTQVGALLANQLRLPA